VTSAAAQALLVVAVVLVILAIGVLVWVYGRWLAQRAILRREG
jgi:hypothetical protein